VKNRTLLPRALLVLGLTVVAIVFLVPTLTGGPLFGLSFLPKNKISLGLDLQGGTHLVMAVEVEKAIENSANQTIEELRRELRKDGVRPKKIERLDGSRIQVVVPADGREKLNQTLEEHFPNLQTVASRADDGDFVTELTVNPRDVQHMRENAVDQSLETIRNRIDQFGVAEPVIQRQGDRDILIQLPGITDPQRAKDLIGRTAVLEFKLVRQGGGAEQYADGTKPLPAGTEVLYEVEKDQVGSRRKKGKPILVESPTLMTGDVLTDARVQTGQYGNQYVVGVTLDSRGARIFEDLTGANVGRQLAIILDNNVYSAPVIKTKIPGGQAIIEGNFDINEAKDLAIVLRAGALPAPVTVAEERTVGPTLGQDSIRRGLTSFAVGGSLVVIFMLVYYKFAGFLADLALVLNVLYLLAGLAAFDATLTLPGIAGIVLTIGMAVDANVLINERIREELRLGKSARAAIDAGYERALPSILDTHVTTFLSGIILFQFGSGPVRGFAITLCIGLVSSVFTAFVVTRTIYDYLLTRWRLQTVSI